MKSLKQFLTFDFMGFIEDKTLVLDNVSRWVDYNSDNAEVLGLKLTVFIEKDDTEYKDGKTRDNRREKMIIKVPNSQQFEAQFNSKIDGEIRFKGFNKAVVYGEYSNNLSVEVSPNHIVMSSKEK